MFNFFKKKQNNTYMLGAVAKGKVVELKEVNDPTFNSGMLGQGVAIVPSEGKIYAPADGEIARGGGGGGGRGGRGGGGEFRGGGGGEGGVEGRRI